MGAALLSTLLQGTYRKMNLTCMSLKEKLRVLRGNLGKEDANSMQILTQGVTMLPNHTALCDPNVL